MNKYLVVLLGAILVLSVFILPMGLAILVAIAIFLIVAVSQSRKEKTEGFLGNPKTWSTVSIVAGVILVIYVIAMLNGNLSDNFNDLLFDIQWKDSTSEKVAGDSKSSSDSGDVKQVGLGPVWTPSAPEFVSENEGTVDWPHLRLMDEWVETTGLSGCNVSYLQSGTPNSLSLYETEGNFGEVPEGLTLIFGAYTANLELKEENYSYSNGFYAVLLSKTEIQSLEITDGFALLAPNSCAEAEFCYRMAQAIEEGWAYEHAFHGEGWDLNVCEGIYTVPLDSDR